MAPGLPPALVLAKLCFLPLPQESPVFSFSLFYLFVCFVFVFFPQCPKVDSFYCLSLEIKDFVPKGNTLKKYSKASPVMSSQTESHRKWKSRDTAPRLQEWAHQSGLPERSFRSLFSLQRADVLKYIQDLKVFSAGKGTGRDLITVLFLLCFSAYRFNVLLLLLST